MLPIKVARPVQQPHHWRCHAGHGTKRGFTRKPREKLLCSFTLQVASHDRLALETARPKDCQGVAAWIRNLSHTSPHALNRLALWRLSGGPNRRGPLLFLYFLHDFRQAWLRLTLLGGNNTSPPFMEPAKRIDWPETQNAWTRQFGGCLCIQELLVEEVMEKIGHASVDKNTPHILIRLLGRSEVAIATSRSLYGGDVTRNGRRSFLESAERRSRGYLRPFRCGWRVWLMPGHFSAGEASRFAYGA